MELNIANNKSNSTSQGEGKENGSGEGKDAKKKEKKYRLDPKEDFPSVFKDWDMRNKLLETLPLHKARKLKKNPKVLDEAQGPLDIKYPSDAVTPWICGRSISTYPHLPGKPQRDGDPVCDCYGIQLLEENVMLAVVCDGCNWGRRPMEASNRARDALLEYMRLHSGDIADVRDAGHYLLRSISYCHAKIIEGKEDLWEAGTTTLLGGMLFRLKDKEDSKDKWAWVAVSIGDCKCFHYQPAKDMITEITAGNRQNVYDARDPGGRLGPYVGDGEPDLRNLFLYFRQCEENDVILIISDGVHDNLDPQTLGKFPADAGPEYAKYKDWKDFPSESELERAKTEYMMRFLVNDLICGGEEDRKMRMKVFSFSNTDEDVASPTNITNRIMKHCLGVTAAGRQWMEQNPKDKLPLDYVNYPGKMDHATAVVLKVGKFEHMLSGQAKRKPAPNK